MKKDQTSDYNKLYDYVDNKMVEGDEEASELINP